MTVTDTNYVGERPRQENKAKLWTGRVLWLLVVPFMFFDAALHMAAPPMVVSLSQKIGVPATALFPLGLIELIAMVLYCVPRSAALGAIIMTGYLGGAVATDLIARQNFVFPIVFGVVLWASLVLRDERYLALARKSLA